MNEQNLELLMVLEEIKIEIERQRLLLLLQLNLEEVFYEV